MKDTRPASEKQTRWIKSHFREQIRSGEIDGELFGGFLNKRLCVEYLESQGDLPVRYQNTEIKYEIKGA